MNKSIFHRSFHLNGNSFNSVNELLAYSRLQVPSIYSFLFDWFSSDELTVQTSGSTGKPKPIQLKKEFMINSALATGSFFNLQENTSALLCLSPDYIAGKMMLVRALTLGWKLDVVEPIGNPLKNIEKEYDFSAMVPMQLQSSLPYIYKVRKLIVGGGVVSIDLKEKLQNISTKVFATYGMTETITHIAVKKLNNYNTLERNGANFYKTLPNVKIYIDERSCLAIEASIVSKEFIITNDVVQLVSENQFEWLGRFDNVINSGGIKLHPEKIEEKLTTVIKQRFFVTGIPDEILGEKLVLIVEGDKDESLTNTISSLDKMSKYEKPKEIYFVKQFVETETKKIQRAKTLRKILL